MSRSPFIPRQILEPLIVKARAQRKTWKQIAKEAGHYHHVYLAALYARWRGSIDCAEAIAREGKENVPFEAEGASEPAEPPAAPEATPGNSPQAGTSTKT
jgi:hypothetical protein